jgi:hypothetical protein
LWTSGELAIEACGDKYEVYVGNTFCRAFARLEDAKAFANGLSE